MPEESKSKFRQAVERLKDAVGDLTSLEVQTITGTIEGLKAAEAGDKPETGGSVIDWKKAIKTAKTSTDVSLVLATKINFDGDATLFVRSGEIPEYMLKAHEQAVEAGMMVRSDLMNLAAETIRGFLPK